MRNLWLFAVLLALLPGAIAQSTQKQYVAHEEVTLVATAAALTVQAFGPTTPSIEFVSASVQCDVAAIVTVVIDGSAATTTAGTAVPVGRGRSAAVGKVFTASNVGAGVDIMEFAIVADSIGSVGLTGVSIDSSAATSQNLTLKTNSITGDCDLWIVWREF